jgi:DNA-binding HxlR family transcriptional regulator
VKRRDRRSDCPINFALEIFGDTWSLLILRDLMFTGKRTFGEFLASEERIATNVLAGRLRLLEEANLIRTEGSGRAVRYSLTAKGLDLLPLLLELVSWSARYDPCTAALPAFVERIRADRVALIEELRARLTLEHGIEATPRARRRPAARRPARRKA